ncbi:MAG: hypothetical protein R6X06_03400 [Gammaproteobacteria bacterium]
MNTHIYQAVMISSLLACMGQAQALNKFDYVNVAKGDGINILDGKIFIHPNNGNYGTASKSTVPYHVKVKAGCKGQNMLKKVFVSLGTENVSKDVIEYSDNFRVNVNANLQKTLPWTTVKMDLPMTKLGFNPATLCQNNLNDKMAKGASKQQVMAQDQVLSKGVWITAVASCGKMGKTNDNHGSTFTGAELKVICKAGAAGGPNSIQKQPKLPPVGGMNVQNQIQVTAASLQATPYQLTTTCPTKAKLTGTITATAPGTVQYKVMFLGHGETPVRNLHFNQAGTRNIELVEFPTDTSMPTGSATLKVLSPNVEYAYAKFKVNCIAAGGPGSVLQQPQPSASPNVGKIQAAPAPKPGTIQASPITLTPAPKTPSKVATPVAKPKIQMIEATPVKEATPVLRRLPARSVEEETREATRDPVR